MKKNVLKMLRKWQQKLLFDDDFTANHEKIVFNNYFAQTLKLSQMTII